MTTCRETEDLIERYLDREASPREERALTEHLAGCAACRQWLEREAWVDADLAAAFAVAEPSPELGTRVWEHCRHEASEEKWGWIADGLHVVGGLAMFVFATALLGPSDSHSGAIPMAIAGSAAALVLYPSWLGRLGRGDVESP